MSRLRFNKSTTPASPAANKAEVFYASDLAAGAGAASTALAGKDESGNVARIAGFGTKDYRLVKVTHVLQGTTTYTPTAGVQALYVECIGGGGQGGGAATSSTQVSVGGGGGAGAYSGKWVTAAGVKTSYTVQVGAGGTTGAAGATGQTGTDTTFDSPSVCTAKGGVGGAVLAAGTTLIAAAGAAGGAAASGVGDDLFGGSDGGNCLRIGSGTNMGNGGAGGAASIGSGIATGSLATTGGVVGVAGKAFGGGGGGAGTASTAAVGGAGANGLIRVWEYA